jgi:tRNA U34 5-methylaminomethyl-2-thiouridine-forming methyltransferase MnmC
MSTIELVLTADGSNTLFVPELGEHYHSVNGALQESNHVFITSGLLHFIERNPELKKINIFEMGFGTGLNALLALKVAEDLKLEIRYTSVEKFPVPVAVAEQLGYGKLIDNKDSNDFFMQLHTAPWETETRIGNLTLLKINADLVHYMPESPVNLVFFDAFAPDLQPDLWTLDVFVKIYSAMEKSGILTTYSAKGDVRRNLISAGFSIEKLQGPPGKRHMLRATKASS